MAPPAARCCSCGAAQQLDSRFSSAPQCAHRDFAPPLQCVHSFYPFTSSHLHICRSAVPGGGPAHSPKGANTMQETRRTNVRLMAAVIGGSAVVAAGALTLAIGQEHAGPAQLTSSGMTVGETSTQETAPSAPATSLAVP